MNSPRKATQEKPVRGKWKSGQVTIRTYTTTVANTATKTLQQAPVSLTPHDLWMKHIINTPNTYFKWLIIAFVSSIISENIRTNQAAMLSILENYGYGEIRKKLTQLDPVGDIKIVRESDLLVWVSIDDKAKYISEAMGYLQHSLGAFTLPESPWWNTPKMNQAREMEKHGIRVPKIFEDLNAWLNWLEAQPTWKWCGIYIRSEHPRDGEINTRSGILDSLDIGYVSEIGKNDPRFYISGQWQFPSRQSLVNYIQWEYSQEQREKANSHRYNTSQVSFSVWESIPGDNYTVVVDKNVPWYFFIHPISVNDWEIRTKRISETDADDREKKLIDLYKNVQETNKFGNAPIVEIQLQRSYEGKWGDLISIEWEAYFLQALQTYDGTQSDWSLDRELENNEHEVYFVRWVTPKEGTEINIEIVPQWTYYASDELKDNTSSKEGFSIDTYGLSREPALRHFIERRVSWNHDRICVVWFERSEVRNWGDDGFLEMLTMHAGISMLHKTKLTLVISNHIFYDFGSVRKKYLVTQDEFSRYWVARIRIISDGSRAFIKIL
jgi:hypothetical protein